MRTDSLGMFWQDIPVIRTNGERVLGPMPPIPETGWIAPRDFPNLRNAPIIGLDVETYDPELRTNGPGWARRVNSAAKRPDGLPLYLHPVGALVGVSVAAYGRAWYFPIRHTIRPEENLDPESVLAWLKDTLAGPQPKVGTNIVYDVGWLQEEGVTVNGPLIDICYAEALLTETGLLNLDTISTKYLGTGKITNMLYRWCASWYGGKEDDQRKNIWRSPPSLVGPYAEADALLPLQLFEILKSKLEEEQLYEVFDMECRLLRLLLAMRSRGVRVDVMQAERVDVALTSKIESAQQRLNTVVGSEVNVNAAASLAIAFDRAGIKYPRTAKDKPSFTKPFLETVKHPIAELINEVRRCSKLRDTFVRSYILDAHVNGRVFGQFHSMRNEGYGTRSGRFSSSNPNLQNIPAKDEELAPLIRSIFVPEQGASWIRYDYSQIEYRLLLHFAIGPGSDEARLQYHNNPDTDYHAVVQGEIKQRTGRDIGRKPAKSINFGLIYGMGEPLLAEQLGMTRQEAHKLFDDYHKSVPYVKTTMAAVMEWSQQNGYIQTILGRRSRFDLWEPKAYSAERHALPLDQAVRTYVGELQRAGLHKALNRLLQGSAADQIKKTMLVCYENGMFDGDQLPLLTVHDELDFSAVDPTAQAWKDIRYMMETTLPLRVPVKADIEVGLNWGNLKRLQ